MKPGVKICGISTADALAAALKGGASHIGFVFYPPSPRAVTPEQAAGLAARMPSHVRRVGVFVDADDDLLGHARRVAGLDVLQLHGAELPERVAAVRRQSGCEVWRAQGVKTGRDVAAADAYAGTADLLLFDAKVPKAAPADGMVQPGQLPGGNGVRFDWRLLEGRRIGQRWGLSGGLDAGNVADAIRLLHPALVDVSSGVEDAPGVKSVARIEAFLKAAKNA